VTTTSTTKKPKTGGEIDSFCTRCKLDLTHRIIAMVGDAVKKVECKTCGSHHLYRRPKSEPTPAGVRAVKARSERTSSGGSAKGTGERLTAAQKLEREHTQHWERAIAGRAASDFTSYRATLTFQAGELVRHAKFGDGVVTQVLDRQKIEILFKDGPRTMAMALE
jgi:hypothetical protein